MPTGVIERPGLRPAASDDDHRPLRDRPADLAALVAQLSGRAEVPTGWSDSVLAWAARQPSGDQVARQLIEAKRSVVEGASSRRGRDQAAQVATALESVLPAAVAVASQRALDRALTDPLTGLRSRRRLDDELRAALKAADRTGKPLTLALLDVDGLKSINDTLGHAAGDDLLRSLGRAIRATLRANDAGYRFGGDEILLVLPDTDDRAVADIHARLRAAGAPAASLGSATYPADADDAEQLIELADRRLYASKRARPAAAEVRRRAGQTGWRIATTAAVAALFAASATGAGVVLLTHHDGAPDGGRASVAGGTPPIPSAPAHPRQLATTRHHPAAAHVARRTTVREAAPVATAAAQPTPSVSRPLPVRVPTVALPAAVSPPPAPIPTPTTATLVHDTVQTVSSVLSGLLCLATCGQP